MPAPAELQLDLHVVEVAAGVEHSVALCSNGQLFGWGSAKQGQLGTKLRLGPAASIFPPALIELPLPFAQECGGGGGSGSGGGGGGGSNSSVGSDNGGSGGACVNDGVVSKGGGRVKRAQRLHLSAGPAARHTFVTVETGA